MCFKLFLELFEKSTGIHWNIKTRDYWEGKFSINNELNYNITIMKLGWDDPWDISFEEIDSAEGRIDITGKAKENALKIMSTVVYAIDEFVNEVNPDSFQFSAQEPNRINLYRRLISKFNKKYNIKEISHPFLVEFQFTKKY